MVVATKLATTAQSVLAMFVKENKKQTAFEMFKRYQITLHSNPGCYKAVEGLNPSDFSYYDKDGFELNIAEQKFYSAMDYPITHPILNHCCWQEPWFELENKDQGLILDHSMFLCRCPYGGDALRQLESLKKTLPLADLLIRTKTKWGFDFALDAVIDGNVFEVIHVEYDSNNYEQFNNNMIYFDHIVRHTDWKHAAQQVWNQRDQWIHLKGFDQNHWKAKFLINWDKAEYTEKSI